MKKKNRDHIPPGVESGSAMELNTKKIDSQSTSDTSHAPDMDSPIIPEHQIRSKNCIKSSLSAPQLDDINVSVTKTFHSIQNYGETENHSEAENHREELFSVLISYGARPKENQTTQVHLDQIATQPHQCMHGYFCGSENSGCKATLRL